MLLENTKLPSVRAVGRASVRQYFVHSVTLALIIVATMIFYVQSLVLFLEFRQHVESDIKYVACKIKPMQVQDMAFSHFLCIIILVFTV